MRSTDVTIKKGQYVVQCENVYHRFIIVEGELDNDLQTLQ